MTEDVNVPKLIIDPPKQTLLESGPSIGVGATKIADIKNAEEIKPRVAAFLGLGSIGEGGELTANTGIEINPDIPQSINIALVDSLRKTGVHVRVMMHHPVMLDVTIPAGLGNHSGSSGRLPAGKRQPSPAAACPEGPAAGSGRLHPGN